MLKDKARLHMVVISVMFSYGVVSRGVRCQDPNGTLLESWEVPGTTFKFHTISADQVIEDGEIVSEFEKHYGHYDDSNYRPYLYYVLHHMPKKYRDVLEVLDYGRGFYFFNRCDRFIAGRCNTRKLIKVMNTVMDADIKRTWDAAYPRYVNLSLHGISLLDLYIDHDYQLPDCCMYDAREDDGELWPTFPEAKRFLNYKGDPNDGKLFVFEENKYMDKYEALSCRIYFEDEWDDVQYDLDEIMNMDFKTFYSEFCKFCEKNPW